MGIKVKYTWLRFSSCFCSELYFSEPQLSYILIIRTVTIVLVMVEYSFKGEMLFVTSRQIFLTISLLLVFLFLFWFGFGIIPNQSCQGYTTVSIFIYHFWRGPEGYIYGANYWIRVICMQRKHLVFCGISIALLLKKIGKIIFW